MAGGHESQPITITNAQGQQITVIPTQALQQIRPANANIIQMPNMSTMQAFPVQNIPGLGNVQVNIKTERQTESARSMILKPIPLPDHPGQRPQRQQRHHAYTGGASATSARAIYSRPATSAATTTVTTTATTTVHYHHATNHCE